MSSKQLDILIDEIRGLREDIKMVTESRGHSNAHQTNINNQNPVNHNIVESQSQQAPVAQNTLFGMAMPQPGVPAVNAVAQNDIMTHAGKILG